MNVTELVSRTGVLQGSPAPSKNSPTNLHKAGAELWKKTGLEDVGAERVARGLGWFSIGLGLAELMAPRAIARLCGGEGRHTGLIRLYGLREIAAGLMIFSQGRRPAAGMWSRVAGDAIDIATLAAAAVNPRTNKAGVAFATASVLGVTALDIMCAQQLSVAKGSMTESGAIRVKRSTVINRPADEIYEYWRDIENLPRFMYHLQSVERTGERTSHWVSKAPGGATVEWDSEITEDRANELIAWRSVEGSDVYTAGSVRFEPRPGGRGTVVRVDMEYYAPGGVAGTAFAMLFNESPEQQIYDDLRRLKQVLETGEIVRSDGSPEGAGQIIQHPGQPAGR
ncbi:MAG TPA: SRPBCC family protein [Burkholderiales bacterium]|nr:SRPBCC family protein [Burkholderiales bacterium]